MPLSPTSPSPSQTRPASLLAHPLSAPELDPDLLLSAAHLGGLFHHPRWSGSNIGVHELELDGSSLGESHQEHASSKRKWSQRLSETLFDFGKRVKRRAGSLVPRRDSVAPGERLGEREGWSSEALVGSGEGSRDGDGDGDDEWSEGDEVAGDRERRDGGLHRLTADEWVLRLQRERERAELEVEVERIEYAYPNAGPVTRRNVRVQRTLSGASERLRELDEEAREARLAEVRRRQQERARLAMLERGVRIAEREGAFSDASRGKMFTASMAHRTTDEIRAKASAIWRERVEARERRIDEEYRRWMAGERRTSWSKVRGRVMSWVRPESKSKSPRSFKDTAGEVAGASRSNRAAADENRDRERREENVQAIRYAGWGMQSVPWVIF